MTQEPNQDPDFNVNSPGAKTSRTARSPVERGVVWGLIVILLLGVTVEWSARKGYQASLMALENALQEVQESQQRATAAIAFELPGRRLTPQEFAEATRGKMKPGLTAVAIAPLIHGFPSHTAITGRQAASQFTRVDIYRWRGLLRGYVIRVNYVSEPVPVVVSVETEEG